MTERDVLEGPFEAEDLLEEDVAEAAFEAVSLVGVVVAGGAFAINQMVRRWATQVT